MKKIINKKQPLPSLNSLYTPFTSPVPGGQNPKKGTNGRCSTIVEESNGLTNRLRFLLLFLECVMFVIAYFDKVFGAKHRGLSLKRFEP